MADKSVTLRLLATGDQMVRTVRQATSAVERDLKGSEVSVTAYGRAWQRTQSVASVALKTMAVGAVAALGGLAVSINRAIEDADRINELSIQLGISTEKLSGYGYAAKQSGTDLESLNPALRKLTQNMAAAQDPTTRQSELFRALGVEVKDLATGNMRNLEGVIGDVADAFKTLPDGPQKTAVALELLGRQGASAIEFFNLGKQGLREFADEAAAFGLIISKDTAQAADQFNDQLTKLGMAGKGFSMQLAAELLPHLVEFTEQLVEIVNDGHSVREAVDSVAEGVKIVGEAAGFASGMLQDMIEKAEWLISHASQLAEVVSRYMPSMQAGEFLARAHLSARAEWGSGASGSGADLSRLGPALDSAARAQDLTKLLDDLVWGPQQEAAVQGTLDLVASLEEMAPATDATAEALKRYFADRNAATNADKAASEALREQQQELQNLKRINDRNEADRDRELMRSEDAAIAAGDIVNGLRDEAAQILMTDAELRRLAATRAFDAEMKDAQLARTPEQLAALRAEFEAALDVREASIGMAEQQRIAGEEAMRAAEDSARAWEDFAGGLADAVLDGSQGVKRWWKAMIDDMKRQLLQSGLMTLFRSLFGGGSAAPGLSLAGGGGGGGIFSMLGTMFGGGAGGAAGGASGGGFNLSSLFGMGGSGSGAMGGFGSAIGQGVAQGLTSAGMGGLLGGVYGFSGGALAASAPAAALGGGPSALLAGGTASAGAGGGASMAAAIPVIGWIIAGMMANDSLFGSGWRMRSSETTLPNGQTVRGGGGESRIGQLATLGAVGMFDSALQSLGLSERWASLLSGSSVHARLFGRKAPRATNGETTFDFSGAEIGGGERFRTLEEGGLFRSDRRRWHSFDLSGDALDAGRELFDQLRQVMADAAQALQSEAPDRLDAAFKIVNEYDKKGAIKSTKYLVDILGQSWEEATEEAALQRLNAEAIIATIDAALGTAAPQIGDAIVNPIADSIDEGIERMGPGLRDRIGQALAKNLALAGEASAIAERWRDDAEKLMSGAQFLLAAAADIRAGVGLLGEGGSLTDITDLVEDLANAGESLVQTYARVAGSTQLLEDATDLMGVALDLGREEFVRFAAGIADAAGGLDRAQALWSNYFTRFFSENERAALGLGNAQANADTQFGDIGLSAADFQGEGGMAAFRQLFTDTLPTLSAAAVVEWLEAANALGIVIDAQALYNQTLGQAAARTSGQTQEANAILQGVAGERAFANMSSAERAVADVNARFSDLRIALNATNPTLAEAGALERARVLALEDANAALLAQGEDLLGGLVFEESLEGMSEVERAQAEINRQFDGYVDMLLDLGFALDSTQFATLESIRTARLQRAANQGVADSAEAATAAMRETYSMLDVIAAGQQSTQGVAAILNAANIAVNGDGLTEPERELNRVNDQFRGYINQITAAFAATLGIAAGADQADGYADGRGPQWEAAMLLREQALGRINELWGAAITGIGNGADEIGNAVDERYRREMDWIRRLNELRDSLALDPTLSTKTPEQRLAEAQSQYNEGLAAIAAATMTAGTDDDDAARGAFDGLARSYLGEARGYHSSSDAYTAIYDRVLADIEAMIAGSPLTVAQDAAAAGLAAASTAAPIAVDVAPIATGIDGLRTDTRDGTAAVVLELRRLQDRVASLETSNREQTAEIRRANDQALIRTL